MTGLDQVFIRAYGKSTTRPTTSAPPEAKTPTSEAPATSAREVAKTAARLFHAPDQGRVDARHELARPHWSQAVAPPAPSAPAPAPAPIVASVAPIVSPVAPVVEPPVISAPAPIVVSAPAEVLPPPAAPTRAAFEVDRFLWPELCQSLLKSAHWAAAARELSALSREGQQVFVITSQHRGEGRSTLALCLALKLAQQKHRISLIDADFQRPQLARQLKLLPACTWEDVLRGTLPLTESWIESVDDGVTLLPLKDRADATGLTGNARLKEQFSLLRRLSDIVLIDAGSLEDFTDREVLALLGGTAQIDGALIVRDVRKTKAAELDNAARCLDGLGIAHISVVENFVKANPS